MFSAYLFALNMVIKVLETWNEHKGHLVVDDNHRPLPSTTPGEMMARCLPFK